MHIVREPDLDATRAFLETELAALRHRRGQIVQLLAQCRVDYAGRAASSLDQGERLVILKGDGTLLVHTAQKSKPVNWMPPGANEFAVAVEDDQVTLTALRRKPHHEVVKITLIETHLLQALPLRDAEELVLRRTEGDLHKVFFETPELLGPGLSFTTGEKNTVRGPVDLWGTDAEGRRVLVEVKRSKAGIGEATQLWRYVERVRHPDGDGDGDAKNHAAFFEQLRADTSEVRGILAAPGCSATALKMLKDKGLEFVEIDWDDLLAHIDAPRAAGQATLGFFGEAKAKPQLPEATVRTGKKRKR